uniref:Putative tick transposon n=1 Tax=Ixodes ricinus TaxID=34613 RepID=A0A6B0V7C9_IXORI
MSGVFVGESVLTFPKAIVQGPEKLAVCQGEQPPEISKNVGTAAADRIVPRVAQNSQESASSALNDGGSTVGLSPHCGANCHNTDETSHHPLPRFHSAKNYEFPKNSSDRPCQYSWFKRFSWLQYIEYRDVVICQKCIQAFREKGDDPAVIEPSFIKTGFSNWRKPLERFRGHETSRYHVESVTYLEMKKKGLVGIGHLTKHASRQQEEARATLRVIVSLVRYLCNTDQALQGRTKQEDNWIELLDERSGDIPALKKWLTRRDKWLSGAIQNEMIEIMAQMLQHNISTAINMSLFFKIIADETTDMMGDEQFALGGQCQ